MIIFLWAVIKMCHYFHSYVVQACYFFYLITRHFKQCVKVHSFPQSFAIKCTASSSNHFSLLRQAYEPSFFCCLYWAFQGLEVITSY